jgi:hypothetical protein
MQDLSRAAGDLIDVTVGRVRTAAAVLSPWFEVARS